MGDGVRYRISSYRLPNTSFCGQKRIGQFVVCLLGPTGTGKTGAALTLATAFGCSVINCDSRQMYRDFPIVTAQPNPTERSVCPHWLYGFLPTAEKISAGRFARLAAEAMAVIAAEGRLPLLAGGTGLYFRAFLDGLVPIPPVPVAVTEALTAACVAKGPTVLHVWLQAVDPEFAGRIHYNDRQRILRGLAVFIATGRPLSWWWRQEELVENQMNPLKIGLTLEKETLRVLLARRIETMLAAGAIEEIWAAWMACPNLKAPGWSGIGCAELLDWFQGRLSLEDAKARWLQNTLSYAKRQLTWFRKDPDIHWLVADAPGFKANMVGLVERFLA
ncbi:tRNA dimethylallyltransferase [Desulfovibrionales bacterium]